MNSQTKINTKLEIKYQQTINLNERKNKFLLAWVLGGFFGLHRFFINKKLSGSIFLILTIVSYIVLTISIFTKSDYVDVYFLSSIFTIFALFIWSLVDLGVYLKRFNDEKINIMEEI